MREGVEDEAVLGVAEFLTRAGDGDHSGTS
jgi:hypothetical protein